MARRLPIVVAAALLSGAAPAAGQGFYATCAELRAIVAAAQERPPFFSMLRDPSGPRIGFQSCMVIELMEGWPSFACLEQRGDALAHWHRLTEEVIRCFPNAVRLPDHDLPTDRAGEHQANFRIGDAYLSTSEAGISNGAERHVSIFVEGRQDW